MPPQQRTPHSPGDEETAPFGTTMRRVVSQSEISVGANHEVQEYKVRKSSLPGYVLLARRIAQEAIII